MTQPYQTIPSEHHENYIPQQTATTNYSAENWGWTLPSTNPIAPPTADTETAGYPYSTDPYNSPVPEAEMFTQLPSVNAYTVPTPFEPPHARNIISQPPCHVRTPLSPKLNRGSPLATQPPKPKRGRPRKNPFPQPVSPELPQPPRPSSKRTTHNQVERKYREGIVAELERLRLALPMSNLGIVSEAGAEIKAPKAAVLVGAVSYIQELEVENEQLRRENVMLRFAREEGNGARWLCS